MTVQDATEQPDASIDIGLVLSAVLKRAIRIVLVTLILCAATYAVLLFQPRLYESSAGLLLEPRTNAFFRATNDPSGTTYLIDEATLASQIELIKSPGTLLAAIEEVGLREVPEFSRVRSGALAAFGIGGMRDATDAELVAGVADALVVAQERNSRLISVNFRSQDPELAARMANAIARAHVTLRAGQQLTDTLDASTWLGQEIASLRQRVGDAERAVADFRVDNDLLQGANNTSLVDQQLSDFARQLTAATERRNAAQSRAQLIRNLVDSGQSVNGVSDVQASPVVQQLSQELARLQGERAQQSATLLGNHPTIRALDAQIAALNQQIGQEGLRVAQALEAQAQIEASLEASLRQEIEGLKVTAGTATVEGVTLAELEREAAALRELLNAYLIRYSEAAARTDPSAAMPDVRIVSQATPSGSPVSPRSSLILAAVFIVSLILQVGAIIFGELLSGRAIVEKGRRPKGEGSPESSGSTSGREPAILRLADATPARLTPIDVEIEALAAAAAGGAERVVIIASRDAAQDSVAFAERLTAKLVGNGLSVAEIDAASQQQGLEPGLADLCADEADFGDVVHRGMDERFAFVPWGQTARIAGDTGRALTLVQALADIYEAVVIVTGETGITSHMNLFSGVEARCILLADDPDTAGSAIVDIHALGFETVSVVAADALRSEVACASGR